MRTYLQHVSRAAAGIESAPFGISPRKRGGMIFITIDRPRMYPEIYNKKECTKMKKLFSAILALTMIFMLASCGVTEEEVITVYNSSELYIDRVVIAPEENVLESTKKIVLFDSRENPELRMNPTSSEDFTVDVPVSLEDSVWYVSVSAAPEAFLGMYTATENFGAMFEDGIWGMKIFFEDVEIQNIVITTLDDSDI